MDTLANELREKILFDVSREDLINFCEVDDVSREICHPNNDSFWRRRVKRDYGNFNIAESPNWFEIWKELSQGYTFRYSYALQINQSENFGTTIEFTPSQNDMILYETIIPSVVGKFIETDDSNAFRSAKMFYGQHEVTIVLYPTKSMIETRYNEPPEFDDKDLDFDNTTEVQYHNLLNTMEDAYHDLFYMLVEAIYDRPLKYVEWDFLQDTGQRRDHYIGLHGIITVAEWEKLTPEKRAKWEKAPIRSALTLEILPTQY